jgi:hypothetical protein
MSSDILNSDAEGYYTLQGRDEQNYAKIRDSRGVGPGGERLRWRVTWVLSLHLPPIGLTTYAK